MAGFFSRLFERASRPREPRVVTIRDPAEANRIEVQTPMSIGGVERGPDLKCQGCGSVNLDEILLTTGGDDGDPELWRERPIAVDGFRCTQCGLFLLPRFLSPEEIQELEQEGIAAVTLGQLDEAELAFRRVCNSWSRYAGGRANLAALYLTRADAASDARMPDAIISRYLRMSETHVRDGLRADAPPIARLMGTLVRVLLRRDAVSEARTAVEQALSVAELEAEDREALLELVPFIETRSDLFERARMTIETSLVLHHMEKAPYDNEDKRQIRAAIELLSQHHRGNPTKWEAVWLAGRAYEAIGEYETAVQIMEQGYKQHPELEEFRRCFVSTLLHVGRAAEAEPILRGLLADHPEDASLVSDIALAQLVGGDPETAERTMQEALAMPAGQTKHTYELAQVIKDVRAGKRGIPTLQDLEKEAS